MKEELTKLLLGGKVIIGFERSLKAVMSGAVKKVIIASNCDENRKNAIITAASDKGITVDVASINNEELGVVCKKPFRVAVISIKA